jgi:drug/metabolite transporter (DMT)-like permease
MRSTYVKLIATVFFWGSNFEIGKIALQSFSPMMAALLRLVFGAMVLIIFSLKAGVFKGLKLSLDTSLLILTSAVTGVFLYNYLFFGGVGLLPTARGALIIASSTVFTVLFGRLFANEPLSKQKIAGVFLAVLGTAFVILRGDIGRLGANAWGKGETFILLSALSWSIYTILGKKLTKILNSLTISTLSASIGVVLLLIYNISYEDFGQLAQASTKSYVAIFYIGFTATGLAYMWFYEAVQKLGASNAAVVGTLTPVFAVLVAVFFGEQVNTITILAALVVIFGIWLCNKA